jgi:alcohol dehydrogenase YqhD (iron-dependent ADH family)
MGNGIIIDYKRKLLQGSHNNLTKYKQIVMVIYGGSMVKQVTIYHTVATGVLWKFNSSWTN